MTNGISKKSIRFRFRMTIIIILIIMTIIFIYSNRMKDKIIDDYNRYMDINVKLSNLSLGLIRGGPTLIPIIRRRIGR